MRVKIYQINPERDRNRMKFMSLSDSQSPDPSIYDEVFDAEIDENELEEIYGRFNTVGHPLFRGHSLSVSDVVVANGKASICQSIGFRDVSFDTTKTHKPDNLMRVVYVEPNKAPYRNGGMITHEQLKHYRKDIRAEIFNFIRQLPTNIEVEVNGVK